MADAKDTTVPKGEKKACDDAAGGSAAPAASRLSWENGDESKLSKNQLKKKHRWERAMEVKKRRKTQEKEARWEKAKKEGRDLEAERKMMEERRKDGSGWAKRNQLWWERFRAEAPGYQICIDCSFEESMTPKEINSLASQIQYCYSANKRSRCPTTVKLTSLQGMTLDYLKNVPGFVGWDNRAFHHTSQSLEDAYPDKSKIIYLTSDSENVIDHIEDDKIYCIGGIVDRNRLKRAAIDRAESVEIKTARLPITDVLNLVTTKVLTTNHVFQILLKYKELGDWKSALLAVLPKRKNAEGKEENGDDKEKNDNDNGEEKHDTETKSQADNNNASS